MAPSKHYRDWLYAATIIPQLFGMLAMDFVQFYPSALYASPSAPLHFLVSLREQYVAASGDPFFARPHHAPWFAVFVYQELLLQFPLAVYAVPHLLARARLRGPAELAALVYALLTALSSAACLAELYHMGPDVLAEESRALVMYGTYLPYAVIPGIMAVDMYLRLLSRVSGTQTKSKTN